MDLSISELVPSETVELKQGDTNPLTGEAVQSDCKIVITYKPALPESDYKRESLRMALESFRDSTAIPANVKTAFSKGGVNYRRYYPKGTSELRDSNGKLITTGNDPIAYGNLTAQELKAIAMYAELNSTTYTLEEGVLDTLHKRIAEQYGQLIYENGKLLAYRKTLRSFLEEMDAAYNVSTVDIVQYESFRTILAIMGKGIKAEDRTTEQVNANISEISALNNVGATLVASLQQWTQSRLAKTLGSNSSETAKSLTAPSETAKSLTAPSETPPNKGEIEYSVLPS